MEEKNNKIVATYTVEIHEDDKVSFTPGEGNMNTMSIVNHIISLGDELKEERMILRAKSEIFYELNKLAQAPTPDAE